MAKPAQSAGAAAEKLSTGSLEALIERLNPSTAWSSKRGKMSRPPEGTSTAPRRGPSWRSLSRRDPRKSLTIEVAYRGGPNAWYEVKSRGGVAYVRGCTTIHDLIGDITGQHQWPL